MTRHPAKILSLFTLGLLLGACDDASTPGHGDGEVDGGNDGAIDDGGLDGSQPGDDIDWSHCPTADSFVGDEEWSIEYVVPEDEILCGPRVVEIDPSAELPIKREFDRKALWRIVAGSYRIPSGELSADFFLPSCIGRRAGMPVVENAGTGIISRTAEDGAFQANFEWPLSDGTLKGYFWIQDLEDLLPAARHCADDDPCDVPGAPGYFGACVADDAPVGGDHHVTTADGDFRFVIGEQPDLVGLGPYPTPILRSYGTWKGHAFDTTDYWHLVHVATHHAFTRNFAVLFDEPIEGVCGAEFTGLEIYDNDGEDGELAPNHGYTLDCEANRIEEIAISSHVWTDSP